MAVTVIVHHESFVADKRNCANSYRVDRVPEVSSNSGDFSAERKEPHGDVRASYERASSSRTSS